MAHKTVKQLRPQVFEDARGAVIFPARAAAVRRPLKEGGLREFHLATLNPGAVRGNHMHPDHDEYLLCVGGEGELVVALKAGRKTIRLNNGMVKIPKGAPHAIANRGKGPLTVACFYGPSKKKLTRRPAEVI